MEFPIHHIATQKHWADLVLNPSTLQQIDQLFTWLKQHKENVNTRDSLRNGFRALFYGPAGTGKSLTAAILGNELDTEVYEIDLSHLVSKYIGETEKNLELLFESAESKGWILFFDEADALFGKRTGVKDSHDKYANQEINYLLQRIEDYNGLVIVSSNSKPNLDDAFTRRFHSLIHFPLPSAAERRRIWEIAFLENKLMQESIDLDSIAEKYELSPDSIMNIVRYVNDMNLSQSIATITGEQVIKAIKRQYDKEPIPR